MRNRITRFRKEKYCNCYNGNSNIIRDKTPIVNAPVVWGE